MSLRPSFLFKHLCMDFPRFSFFVVSLFVHFLAGVNSSTFTLLNKCSYTVWPGMLSSAGTAEISTTGFMLRPGESNTLIVPTSWSGRVWGRTHCSEDTSGKFSCITGDCGSSTVECKGSGAAPPVTLAEFTLNGYDELDFYDVSLVDGYNLPMLIAAVDGTTGNCTSTGCLAELNGGCPPELSVMGADESSTVACKSACMAFGEPQYCCTGAHANPHTCKPSYYSMLFKNVCPLAYSYAFDDGTSTFTCGSANYVITFCPSITTSLKSWNRQQTQAADLSGWANCGPSKFINFITVAILALSWTFQRLF